MKTEIRAIGGHAASFAWSAFRSFAATVAVLILAGIVLAGLSYYWLSAHPWYYGTLAGAVALVEAVAAGVFLGVKRGLVVATAERVGAIRPGGSMVRLIFERILRITDEEKFGERGGTIGQGLERMPLARADELLSRAARGVTGDAEEGGWVRRTMQTWMLKAVRTCTLAKFREEGAQHGGVNLLKVKDELEQTVDDMIVRKVRAATRTWTVIVIVGLPLLVAVQNGIAMKLLRG